MINKTESSLKCDFCGSTNYKLEKEEGITLIGMDANPIRLICNECSKHTIVVMIK